MSEFTPGPWTAGKLCTIFHGEGYNFSNGDVDIFPPLGESGPVAIVNSEANARLIAAAPEMYEACKRASERLKVGSLLFDALAKVDSK